jgi:hypothetical protein
MQQLANLENNHSYFPPLLVSSQNSKQGQANQGGGLTETR